MKARPFSERQWRDVSGRRGERYAPGVMPGWIDGVYAIRLKKSKRVVYVGESHSQRLYDTVRRHLAVWTEYGDNRISTYTRQGVQVAWRASRNPKAEEKALIAHYAPRDNTKYMEFDDAPARARGEFDDSDLPDVSLVPLGDVVPF